MKKDIEQLLTDNLKNLENLLNIILEQKELLIKKDYLKFQEKDEIKHGLLARILENDKHLTLNNLENKMDNNNIQEIVEKINLILDKMIVIEKENARQLADLNMLLSGNHIEVYKKIIK